MYIRSINSLTIIIPCFNEQETLPAIVKEVLSVDLGATKKEIIIVDDFSSDNSREIIKDLATRHKEIKTIMQDKNSGKGAVLKRGILESTGEAVVIQDADREYDPRDLARLLHIFKEDRADIVFGSRFSGGAPRRVVYLTHTIANKFMTRLSAILNGLYVTDIHTCYIMFDGNWIRQKATKLKSKRFGFNPEIVSMVAKDKSKLRICETNISYYGRNRAEGKKIGWRDGIKAILEIIYFNIF